MSVYNREHFVGGFMFVQTSVFLLTQLCVKHSFLLQKKTFLLCLSSWPKCPTSAVLLPVPSSWGRVGTHSMKLKIMRGFLQVGLWCLCSTTAPHQLFQTMPSGGWSIITVLMASGSKATPQTQGWNGWMLLPWSPLFYHLSLCWILENNS